MNPKKVEPIVYIRNIIPEKYIEEIKEVSTRVIVEPWQHGAPEPEPTADLLECNIVLTAGFRDTLHILEKAPNIKWVQSTSVGIDKMLHPLVQNHEVVITNTKGCTSIPIAEHTIAMISSLARSVPTLVRKQERKEWGDIPVIDLMNATVGIIGYGEIGYEIATRCKALGMRVLGCKRNPQKQNRENDPADLIVGMDDVDQVLSQSDFVVLALPATQETIHSFHKERFEQFKKGSYFINVGRGNTIVEEDLVEYLQNGHIAGAALDVFEVEPLPADHPFWTMDNVIVSPHNAYWSPKTIDRYMELFIQNLQLFSEGKPLLNVVNKQMGY